LKKFHYYIFALPFYLFSLLPFWVIYLLSDLLYFIGFFLIGYRKQVVLTNLRNSFPEKSEEELQRIMKKFYRGLFDIFLETFKILGMSARSMEKRMAFTDLSMIKEISDKKQNMIFVMGHTGNWEWSGHSLALKKLYHVNALYHPLSNKFFDWLMLRLRSRFGMGLIPMQSSIKEMFKQRDTLNSTTFIADQTPSSENAYWTTFLNQETPVFLGTEKIAKKFNYPVVFASIEKLKRGHYIIHFRKITDAPVDTPDNFITETHTRMLEDAIRKQPESWLWSHRRWKHKRKK
jgi:KDO2-lipid IV(A) lauroyltransferase